MAKIFVTAGASGGHINPALAAALELQKRGHTVHFVLGGSKFAELVAKSGLTTHHLPAAAVNDRGLIGRIIAVGWLVIALIKALRLILAHKPDVVFSAGGYGSVALVFAANLLRTPIVLAEQNVLPGRANTLLAKMATLILLTFEETRPYLPQGIKASIRTTGTPLRTEILTALQAKPEAKNADELHLLVFGGSQGARIFADVVPEALALLPASAQAKVHIAHQVRPEDMPRMREAYSKLKLANVDLQSFFTDMPKRYKRANVLIGRSGTGTMLEAAAFGLPAIYVPLELADGHQKFNAAVAERAGAAIVVPQGDFTPANLLAQLQGLWQNTPKRASMAAAARTLGNLNAVRDVAGAVEDLLEAKIHAQTGATEE